MLGPYYRFQMSSLLSILHRATGIALTAGMLVLAWWLVAAATGPEAYECFQDFAGSIVGQVMLVGWAWSLCYHLLAGIRHMVWDLGHGYDLPTFHKTGWVTIIGSIVLTAIIWVAA